MGSEKLTIKDILRAGFDAVVEQGKAIPIAGMPLAFFDSIHKRCSELDRETLVDLSLKAKQMEIDDIRDALGDQYADQADLRRKVETLAQSFVTFLALNQSLPQSLDELQKGQREIRRIVSSTEGKVDMVLESNQRMAKKFDTLLENKNSFITSTQGSTALPSETGRFHGEIDIAAQRLKSCEPDIALALLEQLESRNWSDLTPRERYRVKANMGHAHRQKGDDDLAAELFLQAYSYQTEDASAIALASRAYFFKGDTEKAYEFADKAYTKDANCSAAVAMYLGTRPEGTSLNELEKYVPDSLFSDCEVCSTLAFRAYRLECFADGEKYARKAIDANPDEWYPYNLLGIILVQWEMERIKGMNKPNANQLWKAIGAFNDADSRSNKIKCSRDRAFLLVNRGAAYTLLDDHTNAEKDFHAALQLAPKDVDVVYNMANHQYRFIDANKALGTLSTIPPSDRSERCVFLSLEAAEATKNLELLQQAWDEAQESNISWNEAELQIRLAYLSSMSQNRAKSGKPDKGIEFLQKYFDDGIPIFYQHFISAQVHLAAKATLKAKPLLLKALEELDETVDKFILFSLGRSLYFAELAKEAFSVLKDLVPRDRVTESAGLLMNCAQETGQDDFIMDFCDDLRKNGVYDEQFIKLEFYEYARYNSMKKCITICQDAMQRDCISNKFKRYLRMHISLFAQHLGIDELIEKNAENLPALDEVEPEWVKNMIQTLLHTNTPEKALDYGYAFFRRYPDNVQSWHGVIVSSGIKSGHEVQPRHFERVETDTAVRYRDEDNGKELWCIIETLDNPQKLLNEYEQDHVLAKAMLGKKVDEIFDLPGPGRAGTVLEIVDKRVYRWRYCADNFANVHPEETPVWAMRADTEDGIEGLIRLILKKTTPYRQHVEDIVEMYRENDIPISMVALLLRKTCFEMAIAFANKSRDIPLRFAWGNHEEQMNCDRSLSESRFIVDATAFVSIVLMRLWDTLKKWGKDLITTEATYQQLRLFSDLCLRSEETLLSVQDDKGKDRLAIIPLDAENSLKDEVGHFLKDSDGSIRVVGGDALTRLEPKPSEDLEKCIDQCTLATIAVAQEQDVVLWIDDRVTARIIAEYWPSVKTVNTQSILTQLREDALFDENEYYELLFKMLVYGYTHVLLDENGFRRAIEITNGDLSDPCLDAVLSMFGNPSILPASILGLALCTIKYLWQSGFLEIRSQNLTVHILDQIFSRSDGRGLVQQIIQGMEIVFSLDVINATKALETCRIWLAYKV